MFFTINLYLHLNCVLMLNWIVYNRTDYLHKMDLALNNVQRLICHKNPTNQPTNQPTKECFHRSLLFKQWKSVHHKLIYHLMSLIWRNWKWIFDMKCCGTLRITKISIEKAKKICSILLTAKSETGFQSFVPVILQSEIKSDQDVHQTTIKML